MKNILTVLGIFAIAATAGAQGMSDKKKSTDSDYLGTYSLFLENNRNEAFRLFQDSDDADRDTTWQFGGIIGLNFNQAAFVNWAAGGENSIAYNALGNAYARYAKGKTLWVTTLDLAYGQTKLGKGPLRKTDDRIELNSKYGHKINDKLFWSGLMNFRTQFDEGFDFPNDSVSISEFMSPAYLTLALGIDYVPHKNFSLMVSPAAAKMTFVNNQRMADAGQFGVEPAEFDEFGEKIRDGENFRFEAGASLTAAYVTSFSEDRIAFSSRLQLFSNYLDRPENIDVNWETLLTFKVNKILNVSLATLLIYDHDIIIREVVDENDPSQDKFGPRTQFREVLSVGVSYTIK